MEEDDQHENGEQKQRDGGALTNTRGYQACLVCIGGEQMRRVDGPSPGQDIDDVEVPEGENRREQDDDHQHRLHHWQGDVPELGDRASPIGLGGFVEFLGDGHQSSQDRNGEEGHAVLGGPAGRGP